MVPESFPFKPERSRLKQKCLGLKAEEDGLEGKRPGLKAEAFRLQAEWFGLKRGSCWFKPGLQRLEGNLRTFEAEERGLKPGKVGLQGEEPLIHGEDFPLKESGPGDPARRFATGRAPECKGSGCASIPARAPAASFEETSAPHRDEAGGFAACSRWLRSKATTPPETRAKTRRIPAGMPAPGAHEATPVEGNRP